jgi:hypothetical protein
VISSVYFLAITISCIASAEAIELAFNFDATRLGSRSARYLMLCAIGNIFYLLFLCFAVAKILILQDVQKYQSDWWDVSLATFFVVVATSIGLIFKSNLEDVRFARESGHGLR